MKDDFLNSDNEYDQFTTSELLDRLNRGGMLFRTRAIAALGRRAAYDETIVGQIITALSLPQNREMRTLGTISIAHIGFACLWAFGSQEAKAQLQAMLERWPEPDRTDLLWFLQSQGVGINTD